MQTFLPYISFHNCAHILDNKRLNKQITETYQILLTLWFDSRWRNHPAVLMWKGYEGALIKYGVICYEEWQKRFLMGERRGKLCHVSGEYLKMFYVQEVKHKKIKIPPWILRKDVLTSHRSNLLRKDWKWYSQFFKNIPTNLPYIWPTKKGDK